MTWKELFYGNKYEIMHTIVLNYNCTHSQRSVQGAPWRTANLDLMATMVAVLSQASRTWQRLLWVQQTPSKGKITSQTQTESRKYRHFSQGTGSPAPTLPGQEYEQGVSLTQPLKSPGNTKCFLMQGGIHLQKTLSPDLMEHKGMGMFRADVGEFVYFKSSSSYYNCDSWISWIPKLLIADLQYWNEDPSIYYVWKYLLVTVRKRFRGLVLLFLTKVFAFFQQK